jgi:hypothetical protein
MTIKSAHSGRRVPPILGCALALTIWFVGMALAATIVTPNAVVAFGDPSRLARAAVAVDAELLNAGPVFVTLRPDNGSTVRELYANGAWVVWPVISAGCAGKARIL